jgi:menaquinone-dependent protoporphyrinogen oxidase
MPKIQVVYASRHGSTAGIADRIAHTLRGRGIEAVVADAAARPDPAGFDGYVVGSAVYTGSWLREGIEFLEASAHILETRPVWLFSSGPLRASAKNENREPEVEVALGPEHGPGSGGRQRVEALGEAVHAREHRVFSGAYDPDEAPRTMSERLIRLMPGSKGILPEGDFREWGQIEAWAGEIADDLKVPVAVR